MFNFFQKKELPLVSIVISHKNSLNLLKGTINSLKEQTYKNFEVIIIDGKSDDGSIKFLNDQKKILNLKIISELDSGISEAYSKGLSYVNGDIVGMSAADERYYPNTIKQVVKWFKKYPKNIVCGGSCKFLNSDEVEIDEYVDDYLNLERHLSCEHICAISTSFFNKKLLGKELFFKTSNKTCPDYDLWSRLALKYQSKKFKWFKYPIVKVLKTEDSMSFRVSSFKQMTEDKISYLKEFLEENCQNPRLKSISFNSCVAGIHMWTAEQISYIKHDAKEIIDYCKKAYLSDKDYSRTQQFIKQHDLSVKKGSKDFSIIPYFSPKNKLKEISNSFQIEILSNNSSKETALYPLKIVTSNSPWGYSATISPDNDIKKLISQNLNNTQEYWVTFMVSIDKGSIGIGKIKDNDLIGEKIIKKSNNQILYFKIHEKEFNYDFLIRSGGEAESIITVNNITISKEIFNKLT